MTKWQKEILREVDRLSESVELSSVQNFIASKYWRNAHFTLGAVSTIFATVSTALIFSDNASTWVGLLSLMVALQTGLMTFLNPKERAELYQLRGVDYQELQTELRQFRASFSDSQSKKSVLANRLREISKQKFAAERKQPTVPGGIFYRLAKKSINRGETSFSVDREG